MKSLEAEALTAPYVLEYSYKRTLGPILSQFFTGLRDGIILGITAEDGRVLVPPQEYDPQSGIALTQMVPVEQTGTVTSFSWVEKPRKKHPLKVPFAWALIQLDGADSSMLHVVEANSMGVMKSGLRVRVKWAEQRVGYMTDIVSFVPVEGGDE